MLRRNVHGTYALKVDICPFILKNILNWENTDTVLYYSKRLVIDSLLAEFTNVIRKVG